MSLLPHNATPLERALEQVAVGALDLPVPTGDLWSPDKAPAALLPFLAWAVSVDDWDPDWTEDRKRKVIAASTAVHRLKGTAEGMRRALEALDYDLNLQELSLSGADPDGLRVDVFIRDEPIDEASQALILRTIENTKNLRSYLERLRIYLASRANVVAELGLRLGEVVNIPAETVSGFFVQDPVSPT